MNLSLQVDLEGEDKLEIPRNELENVSRRNEVWFIPAGRFNPVLVLCGDAISGFSFKITGNVVFVLVWSETETTNNRRRRLQKNQRELISLSFVFLLLQRVIFSNGQIMVVGEIKLYIGAGSD